MDTAAPSLKMSTTISAGWLAGLLSDVDVPKWHQADIKLRPLFGRYAVESGRHWLVMSISAFDPKRT
jgi:hypothetical protein